MNETTIAKVDERLKMLRKECYEVIQEHGDAKPAFALLRVYSKLKMFCEFYDNLTDEDKGYTVIDKPETNAIAQAWDECERDGEAYIDRRLDDPLAVHNMGWPSEGVSIDRSKNSWWKNRSDDE